MKGENNIENAVDCLELFELASTGLKGKFGIDNYELIYSYIERSARSHENSDLFWRFVILKFHRITVADNSSQREVKSTSCKS